MLLQGTSESHPLNQNLSQGYVCTKLILASSYLFGEIILKEIPTKNDQIGVLLIFQN